LSRSNIHRDISVDIESASSVTASKLTLAFHEDGGLTTASKTGIKQSLLSSALKATTSGKYKASFKMRPPRMAMTMVESGGVLPSGFTDFVYPPVDVTELAGVATSPVTVKLTWKADAVLDKSFAVISAAKGAEMGDCSADDVVTSTFDDASSTYSYDVTGLVDGRSYDFKVCGASFRDPIDLSAGATITVDTPARALAVLTNAPSVTSNISALDVTVGRDQDNRKHSSIRDHAVVCAWTD
jgi:hypothetical protein